MNGGTGWARTTPGGRYLYPDPKTTKLVHGFDSSGVEKLKKFEMFFQSRITTHLHLTSSYYPLGPLMVSWERLSNGVKASHNNVFGLWEKTKLEN